MRLINRSSVEAHLPFILTILITYVFCGLFIWFSYDETISIGKTILNNIVPTTITYVLGCVLVNIAELLRQGEKVAYLYNIFTCFAVIIYAVIYIKYLSCEHSNSWTIAEFILTGALLYITVLSYMENFNNKNRSIA